MFRNTQPNPNGYIDKDIIIADKNWWRKIFCGDYNPKAINSPYITFKGGITSWGEDANGKRTCFEYTFLYGLFRFGWHNMLLKHGWKHVSLHYNNNKTEHWFNWHIAYRNKWPFIKIGFEKVWPLCDC